VAQMKKRLSMAVLDDSAAVLVVSMKSSKALGSCLIRLDTNNNQHILEA